VPPGKVQPDAHAALGIDLELAVPLEITELAGEASSNVTTTGDVPAGRSMAPSASWATVMGRYPRL